MKILIVHKAVIPVLQYGGTERVIWYLGKELVKLGHEVRFLVSPQSHCEFAKVISIQPHKSIASQIPEDIDVVHFQAEPDEAISAPYVVTMHGNKSDSKPLDRNTLFVSRNHARRFGSDQFVYNGLDWDDYGMPELKNKRSYFHFLGNASWRVKNLRGAIALIQKTKAERLYVLGGHRLNFNMGFRFTWSPRIRFFGMVGGNEKLDLLQGSKGLIFPVLWDEPFGLALMESLYFGCPVFGTPRGSLPELIPDSVGYLSNDVQALVQAIEDAAQFDREACHLHAKKHFHSKKMAEQYVQKYRQVMNGHFLNEQAPSLITP
ncbi:MAG TPA: glycosyltransferase family 4 protein [Saprospiraceae bacterium]|nr:glycosyltransferase family 4 protein [Saprospiraceae bacterium]